MLSLQGVDVEHISNTSHPGMLISMYFHNHEQTRIIITIASLNVGNVKRICMKKVAEEQALLKLKLKLKNIQTEVMDFNPVGA